MLPGHKILFEKSLTIKTHGCDNSDKGCQPTLLIRAFGLSEELSTEVGLPFLTMVWNPKIFDLELKKNIYDLFDNVSLFQILSWNRYHTFDIPVP